MGPVMSGREMVLAEDLVARCFHEEPDAGPDPAYTPITEKALTILAAELDIRVMLTDVDMPPGLNGYELARHVHERWPGVGILVTSGRRWPTNGDLPQGAAFLAKPMPNEVLVSYVKAAVERAIRAAEDTAVEVERTVVPFPKRAKTLWPSSE